jgi:ABC-type antimicrobial peptide transport system permease subunit
VISYGVSQRTHEIGVRLSLGATRRDVAGRILTRALGLTALGVTLGLVAALISSRLLASLLFGVRPSDPIHILTVAVVSTAIAAFAAWVPARRASRVDPMRAVRAE